MRRLNRLPLSQETLAFLQQRTAEVAKAGDVAAKIEQLWRLQDNRAFREVRTTLAAMASGIERCMYCEDSKGTAIDHFWPKADYPDRAFTWLNYLLACSECNSRKNKRFPLDAQGAPLLLNPVEEEPLDHLAFSPSTGKYETLTRRGEESQDIWRGRRGGKAEERSQTAPVLRRVRRLPANLARAGGRDAHRRGVPPDPQEPPRDRNVAAGLSGQPPLPAPPP